MDTPNQSPADRSRALRVRVENSWLNWIGFGVEVLTLFVVFWYAYTARDQAKTLSQQLSAQQTANAISSASLTTNTRPWVGPTQIELSGFNVNDKSAQTPKVALHIQNFGKSPAFQVRFGVVPVVALVGLPIADLLKAEEKIALVPAATLWPEQTYQAELFFPDGLKAQQVEQIGSGKAQLILFGQIFYRDSSLTKDYQTWLYALYDPTNGRFSTIRLPGLPPDN